jgi:chaperone modulatory protein CbpM
MKTLDEVLVMLNAPIDRPTIEDYIARAWLRPVSSDTGWYFEEIDIARIELVYHLTEEIHVNDAGMDVALSLLDQLYGMRAQMKHLAHAIHQQSPEVQAEIRMMISQK